MARSVPGCGWIVEDHQGDVLPGQMGLVANHWGGVADLGGFHSALEPSDIVEPRTDVGGEDQLPTVFVALGITELPVYFGSWNAACGGKSWGAGSGGGIVMADLPAHREAFAIRRTRTQKDPLAHGSHALHLPRRIR